MNLFFDTSALIKFFHEEEGTDIVTELILDRNNEVREAIGVRPTQLTDR